MENSNIEVVKKIGEFSIGKLYANEIKVYIAAKEAYGEPIFGDIATTKEEILADHPDSDILEGYGVFIGENLVDESDDWYNSIDEAEQFILRSFFLLDKKG